MEQTQLSHSDILEALGIQQCTMTLSSLNEYENALPPALVRMLGYTDEPPANLPAILHQDDQATFRHHAMVVRDASLGQPFRAELRLRDAQGGWSWYEMRHVRQADDRILGMAQGIADRMKEVDALCKERDLYKTVVRESPIGIAIAKPDSAMNWANKKLCDILGYEWFPGLEIDVSSHTHPDDLEDNLERKAQLLAGRIPYFEIEKRYVRTDGEIRLVQLFVYPIWGEDGQMEYGISMSLDITERKILEAKNAQDRMLFNKIFEENPLGISIQYPDSYNATLNKALCDILGYEWYSGIQADLRPHIYPDDMDTNLVMRDKILNQVLKSYKLDKRYIRTDGQIRWVRQHVATIMNEDDTVKLGISMIEDITEQKALQEEIAYNRILLSRLVEESPIGIAIQNVNTQIGTANKTLCDILGYEWEPNIEIHFTPHLHPDDEPLRRNLSAQLQRGAISFFQMEKRYIRTDGEIRWVQHFAYPIKNQTGEIDYGISMTIDITERRAMEQDRKKLITELEARNAEMERFIYTVSHDLKSPLITVQGFLGYLESDIQKGHIERAQRDMEHIHAAVLRMHALLEDLLELSRIGRLVNPYELVNLDLVILEAVKNVTGQINQLHTALTVQNDLPTVYVDRPRIVEVFQNLLDNALKFMGPQPTPHIKIGVTFDDEWVTCFVQDNGIGIEPQYHDKIFGLFDRIATDTDGTGIGLALVRRIIEIHHGRIWVQSSGQGQGTTFYFTLPRQEVSDD